MKAAAAIENEVETRTIPAGEFKAKCLQLMDEVNERNLRVIITKRGRPVGQLIAAPVEEKPFRSIVGRSPNIRILGDITRPILEWSDPSSKWPKDSKKGKDKKRK